MEEITIKKLSQRDADAIMKNLSGESLSNFKLAFHSEAKNALEGKNHIWALCPPAKLVENIYNSENRIYYLVLFGELLYILVGINPTPPNQINISSFARIVTTPRGNGAVCLRKLIETELVPFCRKNGKTSIIAQIATVRSAMVFKHFLRQFPKGIEDLRIFRSSYHFILSN